MKTFFSKHVFDSGDPRPKAEGGRGFSSIKHEGLTLQSTDDRIKPRERRGRDADRGEERERPIRERLAD